MHTHSWRIERQDGALSEGVCKACGARRDFVASARRWPASAAKPLQALGGEWLVAVDQAAKPREVKMPSDEEERAAQRIALTHLVTGCEGAVSELLRTIRERDDRSPATRRAREILAEMLSSWRRTLAALAPPD